jgi:hypothetical protein
MMIDKQAERLARIAELKEKATSSGGASQNTAQTSAEPAAPVTEEKSPFDKQEEELAKIKEEVDAIYAPKIDSLKNEMVYLENNPEDEVDENGKITMSAAKKIDRLNQIKRVIKQTMDTRDARTSEEAEKYREANPLKPVNTGAPRKKTVVRKTQSSPATGGTNQTEVQEAKDNVAETMVNAADTPEKAEAVAKGTVEAAAEVAKDSAASPVADPVSAAERQAATAGGGDGSDSLWEDTIKASENPYVDELYGEDEPVDEPEEDDDYADLGVAATADVPLEITPEEVEAEDIAVKKQELHTEMQTMVQMIRNGEDITEIANRIKIQSESLKHTIPDDSDDIPFTSEEEKLADQRWKERQQLRRMFGRKKGGIF